MLTDCGLLFRAERSSAVVVERKKYLDQVHRRSPVQKRSIPNMKSSATVTTAESSSDPRQPRRFEKKKNIAGNPAATIRCEGRRQLKTLNIVNRSRFEAMNNTIHDSRQAIWHAEFATMRTRLFNLPSGLFPAL
jgi:hypothetical protein